MIEFLYGCGVAAAGCSAWVSKSDVLKRLALILFCGWLVYVNAHPGKLSPILFNLCLDMGILTAVSLTFLSWKESKCCSCCHAIAGILVLMLCLHVVKSADIVTFLSLYTYYFVYNMLFLAQLLLIIGYSVAHIVKEDKQTTQRRCRSWPNLLKESLSQRLQSPL